MDINLADATTEQLKTLANVALYNARTNAQEALRLREEIVKRDSAYAGPSVRHLNSGIESLFLARTFKATPYNLSEEANPYR